MAVKKITPVKKGVKAVKTVKVALDSTKGLRASVVDTDGKSAGSVIIPEEYFGAKPNKQLMAQAVRVYLANQRVGHAATKTRGMVEGSTRKIYKQKGTGRARHGAIRAPIFVGGGIVFGPMPRDYSLKMPQKMKHAALVSALSTKYAEGNVLFVSGFSDVSPKTKTMAKAFAAIGVTKTALFIVPKEAKVVIRSARNLGNTDTVAVSDMHTYGVTTHDKIVFMKEALEYFKK